MLELGTRDMSGDPWFDVLNAAWQAGADYLACQETDDELCARCWIHTSDGLTGELMYRPNGCRWRAGANHWPESVCRDFLRQISVKRPRHNARNHGAD